MIVFFHCFEHGVLSIEIIRFIVLFYNFMFVGFLLQEVTFFDHLFLKNYFLISILLDCFYFFFRKHSLLFNMFLKLKILKYLFQISLYLEIFLFFECISNPEEVFLFPSIFTVVRLFEFFMPTLFFFEFIKIPSVNITIQFGNHWCLHIPDIFPINIFKERMLFNFINSIFT